MASTAWPGPINRPFRSIRLQLTPVHGSHAEPDAECGKPHAYDCDDRFDHARHYTRRGAGVGSANRESRIIMRHSERNSIRREKIHDAGPFHVLCFAYIRDLRGLRWFRVGPLFVSLRALASNLRLG